MNDIGLRALVEALMEQAIASDVVNHETPDCKLCLPDNPCWWHKVLRDELWKSG